MGPSASAALLVEGYGNSITYENIAKALEVGGSQSNLRIFGKPEVHGERRMGVMLARGSDVKDAVEKAKNMRATIKATVSAK